MEESKFSLLIVEDDIDVAEMLTAYFRGQGYEVFTVNWGEDALHTCRSARPDLIILDIRLPDIDGFEVASRLRMNQRTQDIPIIFLTERREREDKLHGLQLGADDYITKPFDIQELRLRVRNALRRTASGPLTNPVTGLAEGNLVDERLRECLQSADWGILVISIQNLKEFSEAYGFVASDDVLRAISLMIHSAMRSEGGPNDFIGHLDATVFLIVAQPKDLTLMEERIRGRLEQSLDYFYPLKDRGKDRPIDQKLSIQMGRLLSTDAEVQTLEELKSRLFYLLH